MNKLLAALVALPFLAGVAMAAQPAPLNDTQMDQVTAGLFVWFSGAANAGTGGFFVHPVNDAPTGTLVSSFPTLDGSTLPGFGRVSIK
jgi:hypothetical protein